MPNCNEYQEMISLLLDAELSAEEAQMLHAHIFECDECRRLYDAFSALSASFAEDLEEPPEELANGVMFKVRAAAAAPKKRRFKIGHYAALAACLAIVVLTATQSNLFRSKMYAAPESAPMEAYADMSITADSAPIPMPETKGSAAEPEEPYGMYDGGISYNTEAEVYDDFCEVVEESDAEAPKPQSYSPMVPAGLPETLTHDGQTYRYTCGMTGPLHGAHAAGTVKTLFPDAVSAVSNAGISAEAEVFFLENALYICTKPNTYIVYQIQ